MFLTDVIWCTNREIVMKKKNHVFPENVQYTYGVMKKHVHCKLYKSILKQFKATSILFRFVFSQHLITRYNIQVYNTTVAPCKRCNISYHDIPQHCLFSYFSTFSSSIGCVGRWYIMQELIGRLQGSDFFDVPGSLEKCSGLPTEAVSKEKKNYQPTEAQLILKQKKKKNP